MNDLDRALHNARSALALPGAVSSWTVRSLVEAVEEKLDDAKRGWT